MLRGEMAALTMTITARALFGVYLGDEVKAIGELINGVADLIEKPKHPRLQEAVKEFAAVVDRIVLQRRRDFQAGSDLLSSLIIARDEESGEMLDDQHIRNEVMGLLLAGYETTANALTWTIYLLSQHTWATQCLRQESRQTLNGAPAHFG